MMVTLDMINQYALEHNLGDDTDVFLILSQMQLAVTDTSRRLAEDVFPAASGKDSFDMVEYTTQDVLNLFNS